MNEHMRVAVDRVEDVLESLHMGWLFEWIVNVLSSSPFNRCLNCLWRRPYTDGLLCSGCFEAFNMRDSL